jgi:hypothetical protein
LSRRGLERLGERGRDLPGLPIEEALQGLPDVLEQVPAVGNLLGLGGGFRRRFGVGGPAVAAEDLDLGVLAQPGLQLGPVSTRQQFDDLAALQVDDDRAVDVALAHGPVVHADDARGWDRLGVGAALLDAAQQGVGARRHAELGRQACARFAAQGEAEVAVGVRQACGGACVLGEQVRDRLAKDAAWAVGVSTEEAPGVKAEQGGPPLDRQVMGMARVPAVDLPGRLGATGARDGRAGGAQAEGDGLGGDLDAVEAKSGVWEQQREQLRGPPGKRGR